ncbi:MAG: RHS repeat-associated core domain-containing protein, partial [Patescibacteria group bacterium]
LNQYEDKNRNATNYTYDNSGNYLTRESSQGITKNYTYDVYGNRSSYTDPLSTNFTYEYDTQENLRKQTNPVGNKVYEYDLENHRTAETDELGHRTNYAYDTDTGASLLRSEKVGDGGVTLTTVREYDWFGNISKEVDPKGNQTRYFYNGANRLATKTEPFNSIEYEYDSSGNLISETNPLGQRTLYFYDARRNPTELRRYLEGDNYVSNKKEYDGLNRVVKEIDGNNNQTLYVYDLANRVTQKTDALAVTTSYSYDNNGNKTLETNPRGNATTFIYDSLNRLTRITNAQNKQTVNSYDANGNLISIVDRRNADGTANLHVTSFTFDSLNRKTEETNSLGQKNIFTYDADSNLRTKTDRENRTWNYSYDEFNRLVSETDPSANATFYVYDLNGNKTAVTYPDATQTNFEYDAANRLTKTTDQLGKMRTYTYDAVGNKLSESDKRGIATSYTYDKLNRLASETNPQNTVTAYAYDGNSNRLTENVAGKTTTYAYDALNRKTQITYPGGKTESSQYDANGNLWRALDGDALVTQFTYDSLDRPTLKALPDGTSVSYSYDNWNNVLNITESSGTSDFGYDNQNRQTRADKTITGLAGKTFATQRTYKNDGQPASLTDAAGIVINYNYNSRGLLESVTRGATTLASYTYNSLGKPATLTYGNGTKTTYDYDSLNRPQDFAITDPANAQLFKQAYSYDEESNRTQLIENDTRTINYTYDNLEQLTGVKYAELGGATDTLTYTYDKWGNRLTARSPFGNTNYSYAADSNELANYTANGRLIAAATYNSNGGLTQETVTRGGKQIRTTTYNWDSQKRLAGITYARNNWFAFLPALANNTLNFSYDYAGNRIKKTANGESTYYLNDGLTVLNEISGDGTISKSIIKGLEQIAEISADGTTTYTHQDILSSTVLLTNQAGAVVAEYEYDVFGDVIGKDEGTATSEKTSYLFTGQEFDPESDLFYYNARYYNPALGRFISRDVVLGKDGDVLSRNLFIYVKNNPLKYTDPTGNEEADVTQDFLERLESGAKKDYGGSGNWIPRIFITYAFLKEQINGILSQLPSSDMDKIPAAVLEEAEGKPVTFKNFGQAAVGPTLNPKAYYPSAASGWLSEERMQEISGGNKILYTEYFLTEPYGYKGLSEVKIGSNDYRYDNPCNVLFGYAGAAAGFSEPTLKVFAGLANKNDYMKAHQNQCYVYPFGWDSSYYDDPFDQQGIQVGIDLWNKYKLDVDSKKLDEMLSTISIKK